MFCILRDFDKIFFKKEINSVYFKSEKYGRVGILNNHEEESMKIVPGPLQINMEEFFYVGFGVVKVQDNIVTILAFPICKTQEEFTIKCGLLKNYGKNCEEMFNITNICTK